MRLIFIFLLSSIIYLNGSVLAQSFTSSNLPILIINTNGQTILDDPKIVADFQIIDNGPGKRNTLTDQPTFSSKIGLELRGSSSQQFPKKPYGIELRDATGQESIKAPLLGMPSESDWVLNATYNDKTLIRETLTYDLNRQMSTYYTPRYQYCEVVLNGSYNGLYILFEKIKRDKNRVDISNIKKTDVSGNDLTGGYIFKIDKQTGSESRGWLSIFNTNVQIDRPKPEDLAEEQFRYASEYVTDFEKTLNGPQYKDPQVGYRKYIDQQSFIDYMLLTELCKNIDGYRVSAYFYKDKDSKGGKLTMGPIWDYNLTYGNANYCAGDSYQGWAFNFNQVCSWADAQVPFWWNRLLTDQQFAGATRTKYQTLRQGVLQTNRVHNYIDSVANVLTEARTRNFQRWPVIGVYVWPNSFVGQTYQQEIDFLKTWASNRLNWMDQNICGFTAAQTATISTNSTAPIQPGQSAPLTLTFTGTGPWSYTLSSGQTGVATTTPTTVNVSPSQTTTYTLQSVNNGCPAAVSGTALITVAAGPPTPPACDFTISANSVSTTCNGSVTLSATCSGTNCQGVNYAWSGNGLNQNGQSVTFNAPASNGQFTYTVTASRTECSNKTATATVSVSGCGTAGGSNCTTFGEVCSGNQYEIRNQIISVTSAGNYPLTISYRAAEKAINALVSVNGTAQPVSYPLSTAYTTQTVGSVYLNAGANTIGLSSGSTGGYICFNSICVGTGGGTPPTPPACDFTISANSVSTTCNGSVTLSATCSGTNCQGVNYAWSGNGLNQNGQSVTFNAPASNGTYTYTLTAKRAGCADKTASSTITVSGCGGATTPACTDFPIVCTGNQYEIRNIIINAATEGDYPLIISYQSHEGSKDGIVRVGTSTQTVRFNQTPYGVYAMATTATVHLVAGNNTVGLSSGLAEGYLCFKRICIGTAGNARTATTLAGEEVDGSLSVSPNPTDGHLRVRFNAQAGQTYQLNLTDMAGHQLHSWGITATDSSVDERLGLPETVRGMVVLQVLREGRLESKKVIVVR